MTTRLRFRNRQMDRPRSPHPPRSRSSLRTPGALLVLLAGATVIRLLPPLVITREELERVLSCLKEVLA